MEKIGRMRVLDEKHLNKSLNDRIRRPALS